MTVAVVLSITKDRLKFLRETNSFFNMFFTNLLFPSLIVNNSYICNNPNKSMTIMATCKLNRSRLLDKKVTHVQLFAHWYLRVFPECLGRFLIVLNNTKKILKNSPVWDRAFLKML